MTERSDEEMGVPASDDLTAEADLRRVRPWPEPRLDRLAVTRDGPSALEQLFNKALVLPVSADGRFPVRSGAGLALAGRPAGGHLDATFDPDRHLLVGRTGDQVWFARPADEVEAAAWPESEGLRTDQLTDDEREVAEAAVAFLGWHRTDPVCERCHQPTRWVPGGGSRRCGNGHEVFPRTDPAVIMAIVDADDRLLLAHQASWPGGRCSVLAGFVEAGESAEAAVAREVSEEVGLTVSDVTYLHSQPWPFPRSLMLGFCARAVGEPRPDGVEIAWARWYARDELVADLDAGTLALPGGASIAGRMIERWRAGQLPLSPATA